MVQGLVKIGKLTRLHGIKGAVLLHLDAGQAPDTGKLRTLFVDINGTPTPFFISEIKSAGKNLVMSFDSVNSTDEAQKLTGKAAFIEKKYLVKTKKQDDLSGYTLIDEQKGEVGVVKEILDMPGQRMLSLEVAGKEVLLPFNEDLVARTDHKNKTIYYTAPEGLIDIFLG